MKLTQLDELVKIAESLPKESSHRKTMLDIIVSAAEDEDIEENKDQDHFKIPDPKALFETRRSLNAKNFEGLSKDHLNQVIAMYKAYIGWYKHMKSKDDMSDYQDFRNSIVNLQDITDEYSGHLLNKEQITKDDPEYKTSMEILRYRWRKDPKTNSSNLHPF